MRTGWTFRQLPFIAEQVGEEAVAPLGRRRGPNHFETAADRVAAVTVAKFILPSKALIFDVGAFWLIAYIISGNAGAVRLAESVTAGNECDGLLIVHRHARKRLSNIACRGNWIWLSIRPFRIHIDQTHLHRAEGILKITIPGVTFVG